MKPLPPHLRDIIAEIREVAVEFGLDFFETIFEMVDYKQMNEIAAYGGFPTRYPHWRFGMEYDQLSKGHTYGVSQIYEMVVNNDPAYAYLLEGNNLVDQKTVIAHVYAHVDFFKNNYYFSKTNRRMVDEMANHGARIRRYVDQQGIEKVEDFIDTCLSIDNLIDYHSPFIERRGDEPEPEELRRREVPKFQAKEYMDEFINPEEFIEQQKERLAEEAEQAKQFPRRPERDVMLFMLEHAPLERWEADLLAIMREEAYYFAPQKQTKIMNEGWACVAADTPVFTSKGLLTMDDVVEADDIAVSDGTHRREVYDRNVIEDHPTVTITTRRGHHLTGSTNHRVRLADATTWKRLDELEIGDEIEIASGAGLWPDEQVRLDGDAGESGGSDGLASPAGRATTAVRAGGAGSAAVEVATSDEGSARHQGGVQTSQRRRSIEIPATVDADLGLFLGLWVGDNDVESSDGTVKWSAADDARIERICGLVQALFGLHPVVEHNGDAGRVVVYAEALSEFLDEAFEWSCDVPHDSVPRAILRSPKTVVVAFLRGLFDAAGAVDERGVLLGPTGETLSEQVQLLLLNFGILSRRHQHNGAWQVDVSGPSVARFRDEIGFESEDKSRALNRSVDNAEWPNVESWTDEVVTIEQGREDVYDISVRTTHRYAAAGFVNHNSYWHSKILTTRILDDSEIIDFADINSRVMSTSKGQLNPYKLGVSLFRDIEDRWNKGKFGKEWEEVDDLERRDSWDKELGLGQEQIFRVRKLYNDVTFIDEFLTEEFAAESKLFTYGYNRKSGHWEIESREFDQIKEKLLKSLTNFGQPFIYVRDANFKNRTELLLHHKFEGTELRQDYARDVLKALYRIWKRPVNIETVRDDEGLLLSFDGDDHDETKWDYEPVSI